MDGGGGGEVVVCIVHDYVRVRSPSPVSSSSSVALLHFVFKSSSSNFGAIFIFEAQKFSLARAF